LTRACALRGDPTTVRQHALQQIDAGDPVPKIRQQQRQVAGARANIQDVSWRFG
jgi:hypothetical protein